MYHEKAAADTSYEYYIVMPGAKEFAQIELKRSFLRKALGPRVAPNGRKKIDEASLVDLVNRPNTAPGAYR